jgi:DNA-binding CsgD family transcriptional regulator
VTPQVARAMMQVASAVDVTELLPDVAAPTLVVHRRDMTQIPVDVPRSLALDLPRGRLVMLEGTQPTLFGEGTTEVVSMLLDFLCDGIEPTGPVGATDGTAPDIAERPGGLSRRELEVLQLLAAGESNRQIARRLGLSTHTVERHVANLYRKIGARGRADATVYALRNGIT